jgi:hypothetical protein
MIHDDSFVQAVQSAQAFAIKAGMPLQDLADQVAKNASKDDVSLKTFAEAVQSVAAAAGRIRIRQTLNER